MRGVWVPSIVPRGQESVARGDLRGLRNHDRLRSERGGGKAREGPRTTGTVRCGGAPRSSLPEVRGSPAVLHGRRWPARGRVRSVREPVHVAPAPGQREGRGGLRW